MFVYGMNLNDPRKPLSGIYCVTMGVFMGIAAFTLHFPLGSSSKKKGK